MSVAEVNRTRTSEANRRRHCGRALTILLATGLVSAGLVAVPRVAGASSSAARWTRQIAIEPFAGDVFTVGENGSLITVDPRSTSPSAPLFQLEGNSLGLTWGQWESATASSLARTVTTRGINYTDFRITMAGLIPGGVYSLFYRTITPDSANPVCGATVEPLVALTARRPRLRQPDSSSLRADGSGAAFFHARVAGRLLDATSLQVWVIYHLDGKVYGPVPNEGESSDCRSSFGIDAMRQFIIIMN